MDSDSDGSKSQHRRASTAPQGELTLRKTHNSRPRSQRPRGKAAQCPCPQRINADKGHGSVRTITQKNYTSRFVRVIFAQGACKSSLYRSREIHELCVSSVRQGRAIFTVLQGLTPSWSRNFRNAQRPSSCFIDQKNPQIPTFSNYACHLCTGVMPSASSSSRKQKKGPPKAEYPPEVAEVRAIPVQIDSIRSHGERSGNPCQPGSPEQMIESSIGPISEPSSVQSTQHVFARCVPW